MGEHQAMQKARNGRLQARGKGWGDTGSAGTVCTSSSAQLQLETVSCQVTTEKRGCILHRLSDGEALCRGILLYARAAISCVVSMRPGSRREAGLEARLMWRGEVGWHGWDANGGLGLVSRPRGLALLGCLVRVPTARLASHHLLNSTTSMFRNIHNFVSSRNSRTT
jgi:hypothetical protein